jgi:periplasmic protein TonB
MNFQVRGYLYSFGVHTAIVALILTIAGTYASLNKRVVIDLSFLGQAKEFSPVDSAGGCSPGDLRRPVASKPCDAKKEEHFAGVQTKPRPVQRPKTEAKVSVVKPVTPVESEALVPLGSPVQESSPGIQTDEQNGGLAGELGDGASRGKEGAGESGGGLGSGQDKGGGAGGSGEAVRGYLNEHFAYIREIIQKNITYPSRARRMGWEGNVIVSFVIRPNGTVCDIKIAESSGFEVLDANVVKTIKCVAPFPKPPVEAEVRMPITYRLGDT